MEDAMPESHEGERLEVFQTLMCIGIPKRSH